MRERERIIKLILLSTFLSVDHTTDVKFKGWSKYVAQKEEDWECLLHSLKQIIFQHLFSNVNFEYLKTQQLPKMDHW